MLIRDKLKLANMALITLVVPVLYLVFVQLQAVKYEHELIATGEIEEIKLIQELRGVTQELVAMTKEVSLGLALSHAIEGSGLLESNAPAEEVGLVALEDRLTQAVGNYAVLGGVGSEEALFTEQLIDRTAAVTAASAGLRGILWNGSLTDLYRHSKKQLEAAERDLFGLLDEHLQHEQHELDESRERVELGIASARSTMFIGTPLIVIVGLATATYISRRISGPLTRLTRLTEKVAAGDLTPIAPVPSRDEIGTLGQALRSMTDELRRAAEARSRTQEELLALNAQLRGSERRFRDVVEASSDWIWETDSELRLTYVSNRFFEMTGLSPAAVLQRHQLEWLEPADHDVSREIESAVAARRPFRGLLFHLRDSAASRRICRLAGCPIVDADGRPQGYRGVASDVTAEIEMQARAQHLALHDALTGLPNRLLFAEQLQQALSAARRQGSAVAVHCIDLDHFKEVNDTLGHGAGDALLIAVGKRLQDTLRESDMLARLGGDEFAIVQPNVEVPADAEVLCHRLIDALTPPIEIDGQLLHVGLSIGVALAPMDGDGPEALLKNADIALYRAKSGRRGTFCFFEAVMDAELQARKALEHDLRQALANGELAIYYQPQVDLSDGRIVGFEALMRWDHPERGRVSPAVFIPLAEETGLIRGVGGWALRTACEQACTWARDVRVSVNMSPAQIRQHDLVLQVEAALAETGLDPKRLEIEITEGVLLDDTEDTLATLTALKALGVRIAMDDFGTGYSSLGYLQRFPFDRIKIDQSFVSELGHSADATSLVRAVLQIGRSLRMEITAEGVETEPQLAVLTAEGCEEAQGFLFAAAVPAAEVPKLLARSPGYRGRETSAISTSQCSWRSPPGMHAEGEAQTATI